MKALGVFCYAGGFTLGMRRSFNVACHLEDAKPYASKTAVKNLGDDLAIIPETPHLDHHWAGHKLAQTHLINRDGSWRTDYDLIYGNPPCAAWSMAGRREGSWRSDGRVDCTRKHLNLLKHHRPRAWVWESVLQTWRSGREFVEEVADEMNEQGYSCTVLLHDAKWIGCPQERKRIFVIAHQCELIFDRPEVADRREAWHAAEHLRKLNDIGEPYDGSEVRRYTWLWDHAEDGGKLVDAYDRVNGANQVMDGKRKAIGLPPSPGRPSFLLRRVGSTGFAKTIIGPTMHHAEPRFLTLKELQTICGYPSWWEWPGNGSPSVSELARGVCPPVAEWLGVNLRDSLALDNPQPTGRFVIDLLKETSSVTRF